MGVKHGFAEGAGAFAGGPPDGMAWGAEAGRAEGLKEKRRRRPHGRGAAL